MAVTMFETDKCNLFVDELEYMGIRECRHYENEVVAALEKEPYDFEVKFKYNAGNKFGLTYDEYIIIDVDSGASYTIYVNDMTLIDTAATTPHEDMLLLLESTISRIYRGDT